MTRITRTTLAAGLALILSPALAPLAHAAELPAARTLIDAHVAAVGGREASMADSDGSIVSKMEIVEAGMKGDLKLYSLGKDKVLTITLPAVGETKMGYIGDVVWSMDAMNGPRVLEGKERAQMLQQFDPLYVLRDASLIESAATTALADSEGRPCYRVEIKWKSGENTADCYGTEDGLLLSTESTAATPMGELKQVSHLSEYTTYGKSKAPKVTKVKVAGMTQLVRIESYDAAKPDAKLFVLPVAIEALVKKSGEAKGETKASSTN